jgi:hypothetical protein
MLRHPIDNADAFGRLFVLGGFSLVPPENSSVQRGEVDASARNRGTVAKFMVVREMRDGPVSDNGVAG